MLKEFRCEPSNEPNKPAICAWKAATEWLLMNTVDLPSNLTGNVPPECMLSIIQGATACSNIITLEIPDENIY